MLASDRDRVKEEYNSFMACSTKDKIDVIKTASVTSAASTATAPCAPSAVSGAASRTPPTTSMKSGRMWGMLLGTFSKDLIPAVNMMFHYRWMVSYFCCHSFMDKNILGLRGSNLRMSHELIYCIFRYVAETSSCSPSATSATATATSSTVRSCCLTR